MKQARRARAAWFASFALVAACAAMPREQVRVEERIRFHQRQLDANPRLSPVHTQLGAAYLDQARLTHDARPLALARTALRRSIEIQPSNETFKMMARVECFAHRFEEALLWGRRALPRRAPIEDADPQLIALLVEAHLALGQDEEARSLLPAGAPRDFSIAAALAAWLSSQKRWEEAASTYDAAADLARADRAAELAHWAQVMAAGALLDGGRPDLARPRLDAARGSDDPLLAIHEAEWLEAQGRPDEALALYETLLARPLPDPELHKKAHRLARKLGLARRARRHFTAAEAGLKRALDAGEVYTLGALAQLYTDSGTRLEEARALAERNLQHRRDRASHEILAEVQRQLAGRR